MKSTSWSLWGRLAALSPDFTAVALFPNLSIHPSKLLRPVFRGQLLLLVARVLLELIATAAATAPDFTKMTTRCHGGKRLL